MLTLNKDLIQIVGKYVKQFELLTSDNVEDYIKANELLFINPIIKNPQKKFDNSITIGNIALADYIFYNYNIIISVETFEETCINGKLEAAKYLYYNNELHEKFNLNVINRLISSVLLKNHIKLAKFLIKKFKLTKVDTQNYYNMYHVLFKLYIRGNIKSCKWLIGKYRFTKQDIIANIRELSEYETPKNLEMVIFWNTYFDFTRNDINNLKQLFVYYCREDNLQITEWICDYYEIDEEYYLDINDISNILINSNWHTFKWFIDKFNIKKEEVTNLILDFKNLEKIKWTIEEFKITKNDFVKNDELTIDFKNYLNDIWTNESITYNYNSIELRSEYYSIFYYLIPELKFTKEDVCVLDILELYSERAKISEEKEDIKFIGFLVDYFHITENEIIDTMKQYYYRDNNMYRMLRNKFGRIRQDRYNNFWWN